MIVPVLARTPEGAKRLLSMVEARGAAAAELISPLKRCAHRLLDPLERVSTLRTRVEAPSEQVAACSSPHVSCLSWCSQDLNSTIRHFSGAERRLYV